MRLDAADIIMFLSWLGLMTLFNWNDASAVWLCAAGWLMTCWFGRRWIDRWLDGTPV
jgi:hypothetical protein